MGAIERAYRTRNCINPTQGLARGTAVTDTGGPLKAPVGKGILSRMFDVFGNVIDRANPLERRAALGASNASIVGGAFNEIGNL